MIQFKQIEAIYNWQLTPEQRSNYKVYYEMTRVMEAFNTAQTTDLFGDMPYTQAFTIHNDLFSQPVILQPKFDTQQSIYDSVLSNLKEASSYFDTATLNTNIVVQSSTVLNVQDILYAGVLSKWSRFANSFVYATRCASLLPTLLGPKPK